jgi:hypothetical protein
VHRRGTGLDAGEIFSLTLKALWQMYVELQCVSNERRDCILNTECIDVFALILGIFNDYFPKQLNHLVFVMKA